MKIKFLFFLPAILLAFFVASCDTIQQASYEDTAVGGNIVDSAMHLPVQNAEVLLLPDGIRSYSDSVGNFYIGKIRVPTSAGNYWLYVSKPGFDTLRYFVTLFAGDTTKRVNLVMFESSKEVYIHYNVKVDEYVNWTSFSSLNLYDLVATQDTNFLFRDMSLRDSSGTRNNYRLKTGWDDQNGYGWRTNLTDLIGNYSQSDFDTLSTLFGGRPLTDNDFWHDRSESFQVPSSPNAVYGFYLWGRYLYGGGPKLYGLIRIADAYNESGSGLNVVIVDLKINRAGRNYFRQY